MPQQPKNSPLIAAIDLGSNSFHMVLAKTDQQDIRILDRMGEKVQMAAGLDEQQRLSEESMQRGLDCLRCFAQRIGDLPPGSVRVVGTSTLRVAVNRREFIERAEAILGHDIDVISGREEARLIYLGVCQSLPDSSGRRLVVDIGGGSTEFIIGQQFEPQYRASLQMGCVSFGQRFFPGGKISASNYAKAYTAARLEMMETEQSLRRLGWQESVGASGTLRSVAQACMEAGFGQGEINSAGIQRLKQQLLQLQDVAQIDFPGIKPERRSIFPSGLAIVEAICDALQIEQIFQADGALREGVLYDLVGRHHHEDVRERSISSFMARYHVDTSHALRVEHKALELLEQVAPDWDLDESWHGELLSWAARVHEAGLDIAHYHFHKHGAYLVEHSDLAGFSRQEQQMMALLVRSHRRNIPAARFDEFGRDATSLLRLCVVLRLAILLHRIRNDQCLPGLRVQVRDNHIGIRFPDAWLDNNPLAAADLAKEAQWLERVNLQLEFA